MSCGSRYHGCQLYRFSRKLPEFEAHFTHLRIFDETPEFRIHRHILTAERHRTKESTRKMCRLVHSQSGKSQKTCRVPTYWHWQSVDYSHFDHIPTNRSYPSYGLKVNKNRGSSICTKGKNAYNMNRSIELNTDI